MAPPARLAFVEVCTAEKDTYRAAVLVTDGTGDPVDFRCTSPVRPTRLQKVLWGSRLTGHLLVHVLGKPVLEALPAPPELVVVRQRLLLDLRGLFASPVVQLVGSPEDPHCRLLGDAPASPGNPAGPVYLRSRGNRDDDLDTGERLLAPFLGACSPAEPFGRILQAVAAVHQEEHSVKAV